MPRPAKPKAPPAKAALDDAMIAGWALAAKGGRYRVKDETVIGLVVQVTSKNRTFLVRKVREGKSKDIVLGRAGVMTVAMARVRALEVLDAIANDKNHKREKPKAGATLVEAWDKFKTTKGPNGAKSPRTIEAYQRAFDLLAPLHGVALKDLVDDAGRQQVKEEHERISRDHGETTADAAMRFLKAAYRSYARRNDSTLRADAYPTSSVEWHNLIHEPEGMGSRELKPWFRDLLKLKNPIRRELHAFTLYTGIRCGDAIDELDWTSTGVINLQWSQVSVPRREVSLPTAKGAKPLVLPISRAALRCLLRAKAAGPVWYDAERADEWVFPADSESGHVEDVRERYGDGLATVGHALRGSFATLGTAAGVDLFRIGVLMGHAVVANSQKITKRYVNDEALKPQSREAVETIAAFIAKHAGCDPDAELTRRHKEDLAPMLASVRAVERAA